MLVLVKNCGYKIEDLRRYHFTLILLYLMQLFIILEQVALDWQCHGAAGISILDTRINVPWIVEPVL